MISHHHRLVFVHVPKCAGMAVEAALGGLPAPQREEQHFTAHQYRRYHPEVWATYHRFAIVRDPLARAWSYVRFYRRWDAVWRKHLAHVSDDVLLRDLLMSTNMLVGRSASAMLTDEVEVLRLETLAESWPAFAARHRLPAALPERNAAPERSSPAAMSPTTQLMIAALMPGDFLRFGYPLPDVSLASLPPDAQGPVHWARLRAWSMRHGGAVRAGEVGAARAELEAWVDALPEETWRQRWRVAVERRPPAFGDPDLLMWAEAIHDDVTTGLGKPSWQPWRP